jgi:hypothetical protein
MSAQEVDAVIANLDEAAGAAGSDEKLASKAERRTLEDQIEETQKALARLLDKKKKRDQEARDRHERELRALLKSERLDDFSIQAWKDAVPKIKALLAEGQATS